MEAIPITITTMVTMMIKSSFYELVSQGRFGSISAGTPFDVVSSLPEVLSYPNAWNKSDLDLGRPAGWFDFGQLEIHVGMNDGPGSLVSLIVVKPKSGGVSALDQQKQFFFDAQGIHVGQPIEDALLLVRNLSLTCGAIERSDDMSVYRIGARAGVICYDAGGRESIYQIEAA